MADARTILVTGGCGFIGSNFVKMLVAEEPSVTIVNLDALTYAGNLSNLAEELENSRHRFVHGDINDRDLVSELIRNDGISGIINIAAETHVDRSITEPEAFVTSNVLGTVSLLQEAHANGIERFLQVSTDEVYGDLGADGIFREDSLIRPNSPYSASKAGGDHFVHAYHHTHGLNTGITRCSNNYGPYQFPEKMIPLMFNNARGDIPLPVYGDGLQVRDWLYVDDHCRAIWAAYCHGRPGEIYNVGGGNEMTNLDVVGLILGYLGKPESLVQHVTDRPGHDRRYAIDAGKIEQALGWGPVVTFEVGIRKTLDWYASNQEWLDSMTSGAYRTYYEEMYAGRGRGEG